MSHSPYLPDDVTDEMIENAYGVPVPDAYCNCEHCHHFDSSWMVCKLACKYNRVDIEALYAMDENSEEFAELARDYSDTCDDFDFDSNTVDDTPNWAEY